MASSPGAAPSPGARTAEHQDLVALAEIELTGELMIAAAAAGAARLGAARIDELLGLRPPAPSRALPQEAS